MTDTTVDVNGKNKTTRRKTSGGSNKNPPIPPTSSNGGGNGSTKGAGGNIPYEYLYPSDDMIERDRASRVIVFILLMLIMTGLVMWISLSLFNALGMPQLGWVVGFAGSVFLGLQLLEKSLIQNDDEQAFITVNTLQTLFSGKRSEEFEKLPLEQQKKLARSYGRVAYGPGAHFAYPWESRDASNNVSLAEATESLEFVLMSEDGTLTGKGSFRLRPNIKGVVGFKLGAAAIASNLSDLVKAEAVAVLGGNSVESASEFLPELNRRLADKFGDLSAERTDFERRFEVFVGDITVGELLGSDDVLKTLNAVSEAAIIRRAIAEYLGYKDMKAVRAAITRGSLTEDQLRRAEERMLQISGQDDIKTTRTLFELDVSGLDPDTAEAFKGLASAVAPFAAQMAGRRSGGAKPGGRNKRKKGSDKK